jgi:hypothetical protein
LIFIENNFIKTKLSECGVVGFKQKEVFDMFKMEMDKLSALK